MSDHSTPRGFQAPQMNGWRLIGLYFYCLLLTTLAAALAGIMATASHWLPGLIH